MAKVEGSFQSVIKGVSQQSPQDRLEGQHGEVVNMIMDPVRGMVRRNGFVMQTVVESDITTLEPRDALADSFSYRAFPFSDGGVDYDLVYRSRARVGTLSDAHLSTLMVYNKTPGSEGFIPVYRDPTDSTIDLYDLYGVSAVTAIGSYLLLAVNGIPGIQSVSPGLTDPQWGTSGAIWIRGGSYSRTYKVTARRASDHATFSVAYTTPQAGYPGVLDLSIVPLQAVGTPYEGFFTNILQANYDTAVNQWTTNASAAIVPSAIAQTLINLLTDQGLGGWGLRGSHMLHDDLEYIEIDDGGDGSFIRGVLTDAKSVDDLTDIHRVGKVVRIAPKNETGDSYYLKAFPRVPGSGDPYQTVIWRETAGEIQRVGFMFAFGRIVNGTLYWAGSPQALQNLILAMTGTTVDVPKFVDSTAGDSTTVPAPHCLTKPIDMLTVFQDRLLVGSGSVINASERGDYLNFYRTTMLTIPASDPIEMFAVGSEDDTIRKAALYDRNLTLYGDKFHYSINGKQALDASAPSMSVQFSISQSADATPVGIGQFVFVLKADEASSSARMLQIQAGVFQDTPALKDVSQQLRDYINGSPAEMVALSSPSMVFVRTEHYLKSKGGFPRARPWGLYVYSYLDNDQQQRITDAWSAWEWSTALGTPIAISQSPSGDAILLYTLAFGGNSSGFPAKAIHVMRCSARPDPTGLPYLDGLRPASVAESDGLLTAGAVQQVKDAVFTSPGAGNSYDPLIVVEDADRFVSAEDPDYTVGDAPPEGVDQFRWTGVNGWASTYAAAYPTAPQDDLWTGTYFPSYVDLTNPFVRDRDGKAITKGELIVVQYDVTMTRTAGFNARVMDAGGSFNDGGFTANYERIRYKSTVWVGRNSKECQVRLEASGFLPLTISQIEWQGNWFGNIKGRA